MKVGKITGRTARWAASLFLGLALLSLASGSAVAAGLTATPDHTDFGTIDEGVNAVITVIIENTGSSTVEITNVQTS